MHYIPFQTTNKAFIRANCTPNMEAALKQTVENGKGANIFKSMYINTPNEDKGAVQVIPVGDIL